MKTKVSFEAENIKFKDIEVDSYQHNGTNYAYATMRGISSVIRQYIKAKYPGIKFQISTDSYAGGDSARIYLSPLDVTEEKCKVIRKDVEAKFSKGSFDGMQDLYCYDSSNCITFQGAVFGAKYVFVEHRPKWGTVEYDKWEQSQQAPE